MQLRYVFKELRTGLRRNLSMHVAVVLTLFVSLTLVGLGGMIRLQSDVTAQALGSELQVIVYLCIEDDPDNPACGSEVTDAQRDSIEQAIEDSPEVGDYRFESKQVFFDKVRELDPSVDTEGEDAELTLRRSPASYWITLADPQESQGIISAVAGLDGVSYVVNSADQVGGIYDVLDVLRYGSLGAAVFLILAALLLVANTIRLAAQARRREIRIMRLVGASTLYISLPFLLEAVVIAALGAGLAAGAVAAFTEFGIQDQLRQQIEFLPWVGWEEYREVLVGVWPPGLLLLAPVLTVLPTLLLTRKYLKV